MDFLISRNQFFYQEIAISLDTKNLDFLISRINFLISRNIILDIKNEIYFLISRNRIFDTKKSISWYHILRRRFTIYLVFLNIKNLISWYQELECLISRIPFFYIKKYLLILQIRKWNSWYEEMISWYKEFNFLISKIEFDFLISGNIFLDIKKVLIKKSRYQEILHKWENGASEYIAWYQEIVFLVMVCQ